MIKWFSIKDWWFVGRHSYGLKIHARCIYCGERS